MIIIAWLVLVWLFTTALAYVARNVLMQIITVINQKKGK